jgi:hypothetical protein
MGLKPLAGNSADGVANPVDVLSHVAQKAVGAAPLPRVWVWDSAGLDASTY